MADLNSKWDFIDSRASLTFLLKIFLIAVKGGKLFSS